MSNVFEETANRLDEIYANIRNKALEDAAKVCETDSVDGYGYLPATAERIRALKSEPTNDR